MSPCEIWPGTIRKSDGRAILRKKYAYRVLWEEVYGALPSEAVLHHLCGNPACVNLSHLSPLTQGEHLAQHGLPGDWGQADKKQCPSGHPYEGDNLYTYRRKDGRVERHCKACRRRHKAASRARQRASRF